MYVRSTWEANFARILRYLEIEFDYEGKRFTLKDGLTYSPDFYMTKRDMYYEIKGHANSRFDWNCNCKNCQKGKKGN